MSTWARSPCRSGSAARAPRLEDAELILELTSAYNTRIIGFADATLGDVTDELSEPAFDPETDGWLVIDQAGALAGYGRATGSGAGDLVDVDVIALDPEITRWLLDRSLDRAREIGRSHGHDRVTLDAGLHRADGPMRRVAAERGFVPATTFLRMRIDHARAGADAGTARPAWSSATEHAQRRDPAGRIRRDGGGVRRPLRSGRDAV